MIAMDTMIPPAPTIEPARNPVPSRPLHVAIVDEELPYPPTSGKRIRTLNLLRRLARKHRLTYLCHRNADPAEARRAVVQFAELGIATVVIDRAVPPRRGPGFYLRLAANLLSSLPYSVASHTSPALRDALREHARSQPVDLWHCEWTPYAHSLRGIVGPRVVVAHNVESVIWQRYAETERNPLKRWYIRGQWRKFARFERTVLREVDRTIAVSDLDAARFRADFDIDRVGIVENGVDLHYFRPRPEWREPSRLLFLGSLDWRPNLDGVDLLLERVFPAVRAACPTAVLELVGRNPPAALRRRVANTPGAELHANVADVRLHLARSGMMVVPLRIGGGSRLKILEALASATPVVSTRIGAEGLLLEPDRHLCVVETIDDLVAAILGGIRCPGRLREQAGEGRQRVQELYGWDVLAAKLERIWIECVAASGGDVSRRAS
jgi:glycosyltransferase involved in cell wall biosynthesis